MNQIPREVERYPGAQSEGAEPKSPDPIDIHVGLRIRQRRIMIGLSQEQLGRRLGVSFQWLQKYERGTNRVGASRLFEIARALAAPVGFFFDEIPDNIVRRYSEVAPGPAESGENQGGVSPNTLDRRETLNLIRAYYRIEDAATRKRILELIKSMAPAST